MPFALFLLSLAAAPTPAAQARELLTAAEAHAAAGDLATAEAEWQRAFTLDPELPLAPDATEAARAARERALAALRARLDEAAARAAAAYTVALPQPEPSDAAPPRPTALAAERDKGYLAGGRLTFGGYAFFVIAENAWGVAPELAFGVNVGPLRIGGATSLLLGNSLAWTLAARVSTASKGWVAYLAAADLGVLYGGARGIFAPFITAHGLGLRARAGRVAFEFRILSLSVLWTGAAVRFMPQTGLSLQL
ncbi:MAG: hypothetical protein IPJ65_03955 [Archangiaceae bacterium]|nr:hypothetical protein [Archangiaceae bacterium]